MDNDGENNKIQPYDLQDKYIIENNRLYLTRNEYDSNSEHNLVFKKYLIPYKIEVDSIIDKYHNEVNHQGTDKTIEVIKNNNYY